MIITIFFRFIDSKIKVVKRISRIEIIFQRNHMALYRSQHAKNDPQYKHTQTSYRPFFSERVCQLLFHPDRPDSQQQSWQCIKEEDTYNDKKYISK